MRLRALGFCKASPRRKLFTVIASYIVQVFQADAFVQAQAAELTVKQWESRRQEVLFHCEDRLNQATVELQSQLTSTAGVIEKLELCLNSEPLMEEPVFQQPSPDISLPPSSEEVQASRSISRLLTLILAMTRLLRFRLMEMLTIYGPGSGCA